MKFEGKLTRDGRFWLAEVPLFDAMTQGRTRKEALSMIADWFETMIDLRDFSAEVRSTGKTFEIDLLADDPRAAAEALRQMCEKLLANTVVEDYVVELLEERP